MQYTVRMWLLFLLMLQFGGRNVEEFELQHKVKTLNNDCFYNYDKYYKIKANRSFSEGMTVKQQDVNNEWIGQHGKRVDLSCPIGSSQTEKDITVCEQPETDKPRTEVSGCRTEGQTENKMEGQVRQGLRL